MTIRRVRTATSISSTAGHAPVAAVPPQKHPGAPEKQRVATEPLGAIEEVAIGLLKPYHRNARTHSPKQVAKIAGSLQAFGWMNPILVDADGTIIAGHGRWLAAKSLNKTTVPVLRIDRLSPDKIKAYRLADNRLAELSGWDTEMLTIELQHLSAIDLDFSIETIGWDYAEIDVILDPPPPGGTGSVRDPADADIPEPQDRAITRPGDLWLLGDHRVLCASAMERESYAVLMAGKKATMVFTDHPYNTKVDGQISGLGKVQHREFAMASGEMTPYEFQRFLTVTIGNMAEVAKPGAVLDFCIDWRCK